MAKKVVLITGANRGIGFETALELAYRNWKIILADKEDLTKTKYDIQSQTGNVDLVCKRFDLSCNKSIRCLAADLCKSEQCLDVLINNAGIFTLENGELDANAKAVLQANHLGPFLLTYLLFDILKKSSPSRVIFVGSSGAFLNTMSEDSLKLNSVDVIFDSLNRYLVYCNSKLLTITTAREFSKRWYNHKVNVNCVHPGMTNTNFLLRKGTSSISSFVFSRIVKYSTQDAQNSGKFVAFMASSKTLETTTGQYFENYQTHQMPKIVDDPSFCQEVWEKSKKSLKLE